MKEKISHLNNLSEETIFSEDGDSGEYEADSEWEESYEWNRWTLINDQMFPTVYVWSRKRRFLLVKRGRTFSWWH